MSKIKKLVKKSKKIARLAAKLDSIPEIRIETTLAMKKNPEIAGEYYPGSQVIFIRKSIATLGEKKACKVILHEIGHYLHHVYFQWKPMYIRRKKRGDRSYYCNSSHLESFAECFADYAWALYRGKNKKIEAFKRLSKMKSILDKIP